MRRDIVLERMKQEGIQLTVENYIALAFMGDRSLDDLGIEELMEIEAAIEKRAVDKLAERK